jgi:hypothetical protein
VGGLVGVWVGLQNSGVALRSNGRENRSLQGAGRGWRRFGSSKYHRHVCMCVCVRARVRACVSACVRACASAYLNATRVSSSQIALAIAAHLFLASSVSRDAACVGACSAHVYSMRIRMRLVCHDEAGRPGMYMLYACAMRIPQVYSLRMCIAYRLVCRCLYAACFHMS